MEVERMWKRHFSWAMLLFYVNRYLTLFGHIPVMMEYFWISSNADKLQVCDVLQRYHQYFAIAVQLIVASLLAIRIYALYGRSRRVLILVFLVIFTALGIGCWSILGHKHVQKPDIYLPTGCSATVTHDEATYMAIAWGGMLAFDVMIFSMTLYKSLVMPRLRGTSLFTVLMRDGAIYFACIVASNLGNMLTFLYGSPFTRGVSTMFTNVISSTMTARLMLNLRHPDLASNCKQTRYPQRTGQRELRFNVDSTYTGEDSGYTDSSILTPVKDRFLHFEGKEAGICPVIDKYENMMLSEARSKV
ncbi:hypothetical protein CPB83DRAFT_550014 [Crepidotus variabilis]|uniref:Uncharacterized protein n=1 Tax=Crepidotus variabilis TaxID=179855 RepID=A0A9P6EAE1_9AGAR|nr:hypothetical protein CPB83DRAFT_550014 [Crepidotus variabilis]